MASSSDDEVLKKRWGKYLRNEHVSGNCVEVSDLIRDLTWLLAIHTVPAVLEEPIRKTLEGIHPDFKMFMSQFHGMIWGLGRYFDVAKPDVPDFPGGLILDEQGSGKTAKAFLIAFAIAQSGGDNLPVIILAKNDVIGTWEEQAGRIFKTKQQIIFLGKHDRFAKNKLGSIIGNSRIAVLSFDKAKDLDDKTIYPCVIVDEAHEFSVPLHSIRASCIFAMTATPKSSGKRSHSEISGSDSVDAVGGSSTLHSVASGGKAKGRTRKSPFVAYNADMHHPTVKMCAGFLKSACDTDFAADDSLITRVRVQELPLLNFIVRDVDLDSVSATLHEIISKGGNSATSKPAFNKVVSSLFFMPWLLLKNPGKRSSGSDMFVRHEGYDFLFFKDKGNSGCTMLAIKEQFDAEFDAEHSLFDAVSKQNDAEMLVEVESEAKPVYVGPYFKTLMDTIGDAVKRHKKTVVYTDFKHEAECIAYLLKSMKGTPRVNFANALGNNSSEVLESFEKDDVQLVILSKTTHGTGLNLQFATAVIMTAIDQDPKHDQQLVGRLHRPGQTNVVDWYHLNGHSSLESMRVATKQNNSEGCSEFFGKEAPTQMSIPL